MVWVLSFCNGLCESKLWTQQFYHNTVAFIAEKQSFHQLTHLADSLRRRAFSPFADSGRPADSLIWDGKR